MSSPIYDWAKLLVSELHPADNDYGSHPTFVKWSEDSPDGRARNRSVCSSFASHVLERAYGYTAKDIGAWFGVPVPQARDYHRTVAAETGFTRIHHAWAIRPGDVIAIAYPAGSKPTGHVMIAASTARRRTPTTPLERGTVQYEIDVIDSANSGHGRADTRYRAGEKAYTGVGHGTLRVYVETDDLTAGYTWSVLAVSKFEPVHTHRFAIGRYDAATAPAPSGKPGRTPLDAVEGGDPSDDAAPDARD